jgi:conjugal transfer pilus assembly protein TraF
MSTAFSTDEKNHKKLLYSMMISFSWKCAVILIWFVMVWCLPSSAKADNFWEERAVGWHWYQDPEENQPNPSDSTVTPDPIATMEALHHQVQKTLDQAILNPTEDNIRQYIALQNQLGERAQRFAEVWKSVLLNSPELDFSLQHPTNNLAKQIDLDQARQQENAAIHQFAQHNGLFFFYRSTCPYCQRFAPILRDFSSRYGLSVIPITTDGISLPEYPHSHSDQGQAERLKVTVEPALFTADPQTHRIIPVSYGLLSEDELRERLLTIAQQAASPEKNP